MNFPALPVAGWNTQTRPPPSWVTHPQVLHHKTLGMSRLGSPMGQAWGNWGARGALHSKTRGVCLQQQGSTYSGDDFPRKQRFTLKQEPEGRSRLFPACFLGMG